MSSVHIVHESVLVTRPEPQASIWAADLQSHGIDAHPLPLIAIDGPADPDAVTRTWHELGQHRALMFVSPAAVEWFFRLRPPGALWPTDTLAAAPGPGTAAALLAAGETTGLTPRQLVSPDAQTAKQFDSETLWPLLAPLPWEGARVAIISGGDQQEARGRTWLSAQWQAHGALVQSVLTYQRGPGQWRAEHRHRAQRALQAPADHIWLFSSSQAIDHLLNDHLPALDLPPPDWAALRAVATHPRIAERCKALGIRRITQARPTLEAVVQALRSAR